MPEFRQDPITGRWVIYSAERALRPMEFATADAAPTSSPCPFCEGNEAETPPEIWADRPSSTKKDGPGWRLRVVPNKFPALLAIGELDARRDGLYECMTGFGAHEVIIEGARHEASLTAMPLDITGSWLFTIRARLRELKRDRRLVHALMFKNVGMRAGASLTHNHSQLIALPMVPAAVKEELEGAERHFERHGACVFCEIVRQDREQRSRIVFDSNGVVILCPYASRFPFEMWVLPSSHGSHFEDSSDVDLEHLTDALLTALRALERTLGAPAYNLILHTAPFNVRSLDSYHWHFEILPRQTMTAGFEWGSGFFINHVLPEDAALRLATGEPFAM